ncbi:hypothetical protein DMC64_33935 [Amycolatopsis sp. WAC 04197]|uniref:hypothetical protein n=1 Tax=Amycolatopsis sp. WAC 04197 TaxID=2203199 RepID=UPI000F7AA38F|nr:hypothetical protein [Amycolatopsis sp. WAC 04197]RSN40769.1 hypothetical protein DMC64_33935 [Amycolatopsis sp. WAC 04197]
MPGTEINGNPDAMSAFSKHLTAPTMPPSLMQRLGTMPSMAGLFEGVAMSLLDKAATASMLALLTKMTEEMVTYSGKVGAAAGAYSAADVASALELASATVKVANQGLSILKQTASTLDQADSATGATEDTGAAAQPSTVQPESV